MNIFPQRDLFMRGHLCADDESSLRITAGQEYSARWISNEAMQNLLTRQLDGRLFPHTHEGDYAHFVVNFFDASGLAISPL